MDALSEVLKTVHVESTACYRVELSAPWGVQMNQFDGTVFLAIIRGSGWLEVEGIETLMPLVGGDLVLLPKSQPHELRDSPPEASDQLDYSTTKFDDLLASHSDNNSGVLRAGGTGLSTTVMYGKFSYTPLPENPLLSALPPLLIIKGEERIVEWLDTTLQFMASEIANARPGVQIVIDRLASILLVQAVRGYIANRECGDRCWLKALSDPIIGSVLNSVHRHPERAWTVEELAEQAGISRTTLFTQFRELVGEPPGKYLTRWRMQRASQILQLEHTTLKDIASLVGYESEASFSKAFKQWMGQSPGAYRQQMLRS